MGELLIHLPEDADTGVEMVHSTLCYPEPMIPPPVALE
jgi:hypothetical protein